MRVRIRSVAPGGVAGAEPLVQVGGFGVHLRLAPPADYDVAQ
jgi:hypothetical protein